MTDFFVTWEIEISADTPEDAARQAWQHMRRADSAANVFTVFDGGGKSTRVDLQEIIEINRLNKAGRPC